MSFGSPNNPYGQPQDPQQPAYGYPQQGQPGYGYPQQGQPGYGYPQAQPGYQAGYGMQPSYANWGQRVLSKLIDVALYLVAYLPLGIIGVKANIPLLAIVGFLAFIGLFIYQVIIEGNTGQTLGKRAVGTRTLKEIDGQPLGPGMAFVRQLAHFLDGLPCYLGYLWPAWDSKRQTFADKVCSSIVIRSQ